MPGGGERAGACSGARPAGRVSGSVASTPSVASPEPGLPRPRRGRPQGQGGRLCSGCSYQAPPVLEPRLRAEPQKVTERPPRPRGPVTCWFRGSQRHGPGRPSGPSAFEPLNYGSERFSQVRESRGGPAGQIFLPLGTSPSEDTGHHAPWNYTLNTQRGRPQHRPWIFCCWEPYSSCL